MDGSKSGANDFLVTFMVGDRAVSRMLSEVIKNKDDALYTRALGIPENFPLPFVREEHGRAYAYAIQMRDRHPYTAMVLTEPFQKRMIENGDYVTFKSATSDIFIHALFISTAALQVGYDKYRLEKNTNVYIGRNRTNDISFHFSDYIAREKHAAICVDADGGVSIEDLKRSIGIYVNGQRVHSRKLEPYDEIFMMGLSIIYMGDYIAVRDLDLDCSLPLVESFTAKPPIEGDDKKYFVSTPRILKSLDSDVIEVDAPPSPFTADKTPALLVIGPSLTMSMVMLASLGVSLFNAINGGQMATIIASGVMALGMLLGSLMWPVLLRRYQKKRTLAEENHRKERYSAYIEDIEKTLEAKRERGVRIMNDSLCPAPMMLCTLLDNESSKLRLWERSYEDEDFLSVRMGLGEQPFHVQLKTPKQGFQLYDDEMRELPAELAKKYGMLSGVPVTLDMRNNHTIGIIGHQENIYDILYEIILNIIALQPYDEAKLVLVTSPRQEQVFDAFKNVPHLWSTDKRVRYLATNPEEVHYIFGMIDEVMKERDGESNRTGEAVPHYIIIVTEPELVERETLFRYIQNADGLGMSVIFAYGEITRLPRFCKTIIQSDDNRTGYYSKNENKNRFIPFAVDRVDMALVRRFASELSRLPIKRDTKVLGIADSISFMQMCRVGSVEELDIEGHWDNNNSARSLAAPVGVMAGGEVFHLDIHEAYHGCHGLVAGTTGSGKSEFLQAYILSLAINYSPKEVAFVLVDFKGGDMARPFMAKPFSPALPHLAATISNLSGNVLYRALISLEAEIKARQRIFNEAAAALGVDKLNINSYQKYYKSGRLTMPLPHLIIIIDEFAQLKTQQPEFLAKLIDVAQVGRSLGIHLILATQKPSGIVDPQIMSNSRFKVCLKVAEKQDSMDMLGRSDAAMIKNPGRLYLQVGYNEVYECIQSGYSGAEYAPTKGYRPDDEITVQMTDHTANPVHSAKIDLSAEKSDKSQLEAVVAQIVALGQKKGISAKPLWLEMLPDRILLSTLHMAERGLCTATVALVDYVRTQEQKPLTIDLTQTGHIALYGASGTGKTTFLQTLVYSMVCGYGYTPEELNLYAMDFGGRNLGYLEALPHTGGVVFADDEAEITELVQVLQDMIDERKRLFAASNCGTFADYRAVSAKTIPAIVVLIDNFASFRDKCMDACDSIIEIIAAGKTYGVYFVVTGSTRNAIYYKAVEHISTCFTLRMNDPNSYLDIHNMRPPVVPEDVSGRGITVIDRTVVAFQTALALDGETEAERLSAISEAYQSLDAGWQGYRPVGLCGAEDTDEEESVSYYAPVERGNAPDPVDEEPESLILGTSKSGALQYGIHLADDYKVCVCANSTQHLGICYRNIMERAAQFDRQMIFIDDGSEAFRNVAEDFPTCRYISTAQELDAFIEEWKPELNHRLENPTEKADQIFLFIGEFNSFFNAITDEQAAFMRKVVQYINSPAYRICFICGFHTAGDKSNDRLYLSLVVNAENYLLCPNCYEEASGKIETLPIIRSNKTGCLCLKAKSTEIRW